MKPPKLYFIIGSSGVGKSTIVPFLKSSLPENFDVHDFDEKLTNEVAMDSALLDEWRKETTKYWIRLAEENAKIGKSTLVLGLVYPHEAAEVETTISITLYLLDASDEAIKERLMGKRFSAPEKVAGLKQATGQTPEEFIEENKSLMNKLRVDVSSVGGTVIDTTDDTPEETTKRIISSII